MVKAIAGVSMSFATRLNKQSGFTFVATLLLLALCALGLSIAGPIWSQQARREHERELLRVGAMYAQALYDYKTKSPGSIKQYPLRLEDLLNDARFIGIQRHIRKLYTDPIDPRRGWGLVLNADKRIIGVYSLSQDEPIAQGLIDLEGVILPPARHYSDWKFIAQVPHGL